MFKMDNDVGKNYFSFSLELYYNNFSFWPTFLLIGRNLSQSMDFVHYNSKN